MSSPTPPAGGDRGYKRSWKNLLINKRYQLQFTLIMVGLAAVLMIGLGIRVMMKANEATTVSKVHVLGKACPAVPTLSTGVQGPTDDGSTDPTPAPAPTDGSAGSATGSAGSAAPDTTLDDVFSQWCNGDEFTCPQKPEQGKPLVVKLAPIGDTKPAATECDDTLDHKLGDGDALEPLHKAQIKAVTCEGGKPHDVPAKARRAKPTIDESSLKLEVSLPPNYFDTIAEHYRCEIEQRGDLEKLDRRKLAILLVLFGSGLVLVVGLGVYGIKMTHKVAGPLFKVSLYLGKMRDGRYDKVYNLRKGDQLVDFYEHFKQAHAGVVAMQRDDIARVKAVIAAAEGAGAGDHPTIVALRELLARKEKSVE